MMDSLKNKVFPLCAGICSNINLMITTGRWNFDIHLVVIYTSVFNAANEQIQKAGSQNSRRDNCLLFYSLCLLSLI